MDSPKGLTVITRATSQPTSQILGSRKRASRKEPVIQTLDSKVEHAHWNMTNLPNAQITARSVLLALFKISLIKSSFELLMIKPLNFKVWKFRDLSLSTQSTRLAQTIGRSTCSRCDPEFIIIAICCHVRYLRHWKGEQNEKYLVNAWYWTLEVEFQSLKSKQSGSRCLFRVKIIIFANYNLENFEYKAWFLSSFLFVSLARIVKRVT